MRKRAFAAVVLAALSILVALPALAAPPLSVTVHENGTAMVRAGISRSVPAGPFVFDDIPVVGMVDGSSLAATGLPGAVRVTALRFEGAGARPFPGTVVKGLRKDGIPFAGRLSALSGAFADVVMEDGVLVRLSADGLSFPGMEGPFVPAVVMEGKASGAVDVKGTVAYRASGLSFSGRHALRLSPDGTWTFAPAAVIVNSTSGTVDCDLTVAAGDVGGGGGRMLMAKAMVADEVAAGGPVPVGNLRLFRLGRTKVRPGTTVIPLADPVAVPADTAYEVSVRVPESGFGRPDHADRVVSFVAPSPFPGGAIDLFAFDGGQWELTGSGWQGPSDKGQKAVVRAGNAMDVTVTPFKTRAAGVSTGGFSVRNTGPKEIRAKVSLSVAGQVPMVSCSAKPVAADFPKGQAAFSLSVPAGGESVVECVLAR